MPPHTHMQVLAGMPQLQSLSLDNVEISGHGRESEANTAGLTLLSDTAWLLHNLSRVTALQHLELIDVDCEPSQVQRLSALTASSHLVSLKVTDTCGGGGPLPLHALEHVLPAGKQLPHLQEMRIVSGGGIFTGYGICVTAEDIQRICALPAQR